MPDLTAYKKSNSKVFIKFSENLGRGYWFLNQNRHRQCCSRTNWGYSNRKQWCPTPLSSMYQLIKRLSHTWVRYPGFSGHGVECPILTTVVPGFSGDLIGCTIRSKWGPFRDLYLARKNLLCVWNKLFLGEIKFSQRRTRPVKSLWWQIVPMQESTNEWKNLAFFLNNGTCGNTMVKPQTVRYRLMK